MRSQEAQRRIQAAIEQLIAQGQLPGTVNGRVNALVELAQTSKQTLYKNLSLWHPEHLLLDQPVPPDIASNIAAQPEVSEKTPKSSSPEKVKELHTLKKVMKSSSPALREVGSDPVFTSPDRGVRGDEISFPQLSQPSSKLPVPLIEIQNGIRHQVQRLGWNANQITQFIRDKFGGRRRSELQDSELILLLYHLQDVSLKLLPGQKPSLL